MNVLVISNSVLKGGSPYKVILGAFSLHEQKQFNALYGFRKFWF